MATPIINKNICYHCLKEFEEKELIKIEIPSLGYGSFFDNFGTSLKLCKECYEKVSDIFNFTTIKDTENCTIYKHEKEMEDYFYSLPIESQELIFNKNSWGAFADLPMDSQDWLDYKIGILSHEKCQQYGLVSKFMIDEFVQKYQKCEHVVNISYQDKHVSSCCFNGSHGLKDGKIDENDIKNNQCAGNCWNCNYFKERNENAPYIQLKFPMEYKYYKIKKEYELNQEKINKIFEE